MTSTRPYRRALPVDFALSEIKNGEGSQFAPDIVGVFLDNRVFEEVEAANLTKDAFASALRSSIMDHL
jgi:HD-GYP domain-containing protein (c-di-GMP phosphodiesterase class II)